MDQSKLIEMRRLYQQMSAMPVYVKTFTDPVAIREALEKMMEYPFEERPFLDVVWSRSFDESDYQDFDECTFILTNLYPKAAEFKDMVNDININWGVNLDKIRQIDVWSEEATRRKR